MTTPPQSCLWIVIGDIHDSTGNFARIPELSQADGIIISGDLTNSGGSSQAEKVMQTIEKASLPVYAQIGNMDLPEVNDWLERTGHNIHAQAKELAPGVCIFGIGGSTFTPMSTPSEFSESDYARWLDECWQKAKNYPHKILISHNPPKNTVCDDIGGGRHVGSTAVRDFIERGQPDICVCGHIHEGRGMDRIGSTPILNPGMFSEGGYVIIRYEDGKITGELDRVAA